MQHEVRVPTLAESISEARLLGWHKQPGDPVRRGDNLVDIETDKVTLEVPAPSDGRVHSLIKEPGQLVSSAEVIALIESEPADEAPVAEALATPPKVPEPSAPFPKPPPAPQPVVATPPVAVVPLEQKAPTVSLPSTPAPQTEPDSAAGGVIAPPTGPAARNLLDEHDLKAAEVTPSGPGGRLLKEDVLRHLNERVAQTATPATPPSEAHQPQSPPQNEPSPPVAATSSKPDAHARATKRVPMSGLRRNIAKRLLQAQHESALLTTFNEVNMLPVMQLRKRYRESFEKRHGIKLGLMSFFTRAAVEALQRFPLLNASIEGDDVLYHEYYDIGIAVSAPRGLVVPALRNADRLTLADIETQIYALSEKARKGGLSVEEMLGGTFTITNGGVFGSLLSTPIINPPQSAILGMHKIQERPVVENGDIVARPMMYLALSYDHRLIDGREAVQFLVNIKEQLEDPARMLIQV